MFPFESLGLAHREAGMIVALLIGVGFGFTLERAGFGRATTLVGQFYLNDMTVFKVMFGAIVTAMLGLVVLGGVGVVDTASVLQTAASETFIWPMLVGGFVLGMGFIVSGYCPGTSLVASASGKLDGMMTFAGVVAGSVLFGELYPLLAGFAKSGAMGQRFLDQVTGIPRPVLALGVALMAVGMFFGAEKVEQIFGARHAGDDDGLRPPRSKGIQRAVFAGIGAVALLAVATLALPGSPRAAAKSEKAKVVPGKKTVRITAAELARRIVDEPWKLRIVDIRDAKKCQAKRVPGSECVEKKKLASLNLDVGPGTRDLVLICGKDLKWAPRAALTYRGRVLVLEGGYKAWIAYALTPPQAPGAMADQTNWSAYKFRAAFHQSMTGRKAAPVVKAAKAYAPKRTKKKRGGCS